MKQTEKIIKEEKLSAKDAIANGLKKGDRVWIEFEVSQSPSKLTQKVNLTLKTIPSGQIFYARIESTEMKIGIKPFMPTHGEKCILETIEGVIHECKPVVLDKKIHAFVEVENGDDLFFFDTEIKQFTPLT
jgi:hypothetical protein